MGERAVFYGTGEGAEVRAVHVAEMGAEGVVFTVEAEGERASVQLKMLGRHNVPNALAAIAVGLRSGMALEECAAAVGEMRAGDKRGEVLEWRGATLINDSYNSNPAALDAMVDALMAMPAERHIVVAGEMLELGPEAAALHAACGRRMAERGVDVVVGVRGAAEAMVEAAQGWWGRRCLSLVRRRLGSGWCECAGGGCGVVEGFARGAAGAGFDGDRRRVSNRDRGLMAS